MSSIETLTIITSLTVGFKLSNVAIQSELPLVTVLALAMAQGADQASEQRGHRNARDNQGAVVFFEDYWQTLGNLFREDISNIQQVHKSTNNFN